MQACFVYGILFKADNVVTMRVFEIVVSPEWVLEGQLLIK